MPPDDVRRQIQAERAFALLLGAIVKADLTGDVELAWRVAEMVAYDHDRRYRYDRPTGG